MIGRRFSDAQIIRMGTITLLALLLIMAASFNLSKFPGFRGTSYTAEFTDASGIHEGNMVMVGGMRVGRVQDVTLDGPKVIVDFEVDNDVEFGKDSRASIEVLNLLGEKYLEVTPVGEGQLDEDTAIPLGRTESAYDIVEVFGDLTTTTESIDKDALKDAFNVLSDTVDAAAPEIQSSFEGISRLSQAVASRDEQLQALFRSSKSVSRLLADRGEDLVDLMGSADLVFQEVRQRKAAIHQLLVNARVMAIELRGLAADNQKQIGPALQEVDDLLDTLILKEKELKATLAALGPYVSILGNIIGTGPWFDAYAMNLVGVFTGEFVPGGVNE
jgi:phospholipid/cholesterol/gamma-HCH transport system substrate-binding protein